MLSLKCKDFDEVFYRLNRLFIRRPFTTIMYAQNILAYSDDVVVEVDGYDCNIDLGKMGYAKTKWSHLVRTYIDWPHLVDYKSRLADLSGLSYTYYFNRNDHNNGSCLICIVLTRQDRGKPWTKVNVNWRVSETNRKLAADLVLINRFINELPKESCDIQKVTFYFNQIYCNAMFINGNLNYFKTSLSTLNKLKNHPWIKSVLSNNEKYFSDGSPINTYKALQTMQHLHFGIKEFKTIIVMDLSIEEYFRNKEEN